MVQDIVINENEFNFGKRCELTADFKYNAAGLVWAPDSKGLYFNALAEGLQAIYKAEKSGDTWTINRLTADNLWFDFDSPWGIVEKDGVTTLLASYCSMDFPNELVAVKLDGSEPQQATHLSIDRA